MLYKSLQKTIKEYENRKKEEQSQSERKIFKWKVFALIFCIIVIILIGVLSQLIQNYVEEQGQIRNFTFLPKLLHQSTQLQDITSIKNFLNGFNKSPRIIFDKSQRLFDSSLVTSQQILQKINQKRNILFFFHLQQQIQPQEPPKVYRFGMLLKTQFDAQTDPSDGVISIYDNIDDLSSVFFNLNQPQAIRLNFNPSCRLYTYNQTTQSLKLIQSINFENSSTLGKKVIFKIAKSQCFGNTEGQSLSRILKITGIELDSVKEEKQLQIVRIEAFYLTFNGQNIQ